jgi:uncharacterized protein YggE
MENLTRRDWLLSYGLAVLAGLFLVLTVNFGAIFERMFPEKAETIISVDGFAESTEDNDSAYMMMEISRGFADSQQAALKEVSSKFERFEAFIKASGAGTITGSGTPSMSSDVVMIGSKKAIEYRALIMFTLKISDLTKINEILRKAAEIEVTNAKDLRFSLTDKKRKEISQKLFEPALADGLERAKAEAKRRGLKLKSNVPRFVTGFDGYLAVPEQCRLIDPLVVTEQKGDYTYRVQLEFVAE